MADEKKQGPQDQEPVELTDEALAHVSGGMHGGGAFGGTVQKVTQDVAANKSKVANKAADALDGYIRG